MPETLARDKHSSLLQKFIKSFITLAPRGTMKILIATFIIKKILITLNMGGITINYTNIITNKKNFYCLNLACRDRRSASWSSFVVDLLARMCSSDRCNPSGAKVLHLFIFAADKLDCLSRESLLKEKDQYH
jgi:hypothetical protein